MPVTINKLTYHIIPQQLNSQQQHCVSGEILKLGGEAMIPYLARLLEITMNNGTLSGDWKKATVIPIHKGEGG